MHAPYPLPTWRLLSDAVSSSSHVIAGPVSPCCDGLDTLRWLNKGAAKLGLEG